MINTSPGNYMGIVFFVGLFFINYTTSLKVIWLLRFLISSGVSFGKSSFSVCHFKVIQNTLFLTVIYTPFMTLVVFIHAFYFSPLNLCFQRFVDIISPLKKTEFCWATLFCLYEFLLLYLLFLFIFFGFIFSFSNFYSWMLANYFLAFMLL